MLLAFAANSFKMQVRPETGAVELQVHFLDPLNLTRRRKRGGEEESGEKAGRREGIIRLKH